MLVNILVVGDVIGKPGRELVKELLPSLKGGYGAHLVIANGENAAGGNGITEAAAEELFSAGVDVLTTGNHVWDRREALEFIDSDPRILRPLNYPPGVPGRGVTVVQVAGGAKVAVMNAAGRVFMVNLDCPFRRMEEELEKLDEEVRLTVVDFHAEATSEKMAMGWFLDGKVGAVVGTHTHVQTADERILPGGTAYITDVGMTGPLDSVIGIKVEPVLERFLTQLPTRFEVARGGCVLSAVVVRLDEGTGKAQEIVRVQKRGGRGGIRGEL